MCMQILPLTQYLECKPFPHKPNSVLFESRRPIFPSLLPLPPGLRSVEPLVGAQQSLKAESGPAGALPICFLRQSITEVSQLWRVVKV